MKAPSAGQVHLNQTVLEAPGLGSSTCKVASTLLVPVWVPEMLLPVWPEPTPVKSMAVAKSSLAGAAKAVPAASHIPKARCLKKSLMVLMIFNFFMITCVYVFSTSGELGDREMAGEIGLIPRPSDVFGNVILADMADSRPDL